jgi:hypothetical protein
MYYLRADQRHMVEPIHGNVNPSKDALAIRFRFPWPDEDGTEPGGFNGDYQRSITVPGATVTDGVKHYTTQFRADAGYVMTLFCPEGPRPPGTEGLTIHRNGFPGAVRLTQQKFLADGRLVPVCMCGGCESLWRLEEPDEIMALAQAFLDEGERRRKDSWLESGEKVGHVFWHTIAQRILEGARLAEPVPA